MLKYLSETPSTQTLVKSGEFNDRDGVYTFNQTAGIGRLGTKWDTSKEEAVCFSFRLEVDVKYPLSMIIGTELAKHLNNEKIQIKWPNDLYIDGEKFCGILVDRVMDEKPFYVVGIGINTKSERFGFINNSKEAMVDLIQKFVKSDFNEFDLNSFEKMNILNDYNINIDGKDYSYDSLKEDGSLNLVHEDKVINLTDKKKIEKKLSKKG